MSNDDTIIWQGLPCIRRHVLEALKILGLTEEFIAALTAPADPSWHPAEQSQTVQLVWAAVGNQAMPRCQRAFAKHYDTLGLLAEA